MTSSSKILRGKQIPAELATWHAPPVEEKANRPANNGNVSGAAVEPKLSPAQELALLREQAVQEGFEEGHAAGLQAGQAELTQHADLLRTVLDGLARPVQTLDNQFEEEMFALVTAISRQLVRRELKLDPAHIVAIIREGLAALPAASADVQVRLHPQDAELIRDLLQPDEKVRPWTIEPDPLMEQGGCRIVTECAQIDGRLDTRLGRIVASMLEDERASSD